MQTRHNPLTFYIRMLLYMVVALFIRVLALAPLACLFLFPAGSPWRYAALLCPALMILLVLPLRFSFAEALVQKPRQRYFSYDTALNMHLYGEKLSEGVRHALNVLKWGVPFFLMLGGCYYCYKQIDMFTLLAQITNIGKTAVGICNSIANFFRSLFSVGEPLTYAGGMGEGLYVVIGALGLGLLIWLFGAMRNSATRYIWVLATRSERALRPEARRRLRGRRMRQLLVALINLVLWAPFVWVVAVSLKGVVSDLSGQLMMALAQKKMPDVDLLSVAKPLIFAFVCLYFPLLPARRYLTAAFATHNVRHTAPTSQSTQAVQPDEPLVDPVADMQAEQAAEYEAPEAPYQADSQPADSRSADAAQ